MRKLNKTFSSLFKNFKMFEAIKLILGNIHCLFFWGVEVNKIQDIILSKKFHDTTTLSGNVFSYNYTKIFRKMKYPLLFFGGCMFMSNMPMLQG